MKQKKYGYFDDENREYVITDPATPYPWINYLGNTDFFSLISNTAGGYIFYKDAKYRRITRYRYNHIPIDDGGRYFYIKDGDTLWNPGWKPVKTELDFYETRHGLNYTKITGEKNGIKAETLYFVPIDAWAEVQKVTITNTGKQTKTIKLFSYVEWALWNAATDMENFQRNLSTGEVEVEGNVIYHKTEYRERRNHYAFYAVNSPVAGFDTDRENFIGLYNSLANPQNVIKGKADNSIAHGWSPIASHYLEISLKPGESKDYIFLLGYVENNPDNKWESKGIINKNKAKKLIDKYNTLAKIDKAWLELKTYWERNLEKFQLISHDKRLDRQVNIWNQYQCMITFNFSRSASYFESGIGRGMGFRDSNQDLIGFVHQAPARARQRILDIAATQFSDGSCYHQYQPLTKRGNNDIGTGFNDDPLWLILGVTAYIKETGDFSILDEKVPFDNNELLADTLFEHLRRSFYFTTNNLGPNGLPLIGRADWNDCLNLNCFSTDPDESFQTTENKTEGSKAESLMIAGLFVYYGQEYVRLCKLSGKKPEAKRAQKEVDRMKKAVISYGWDGNWFLRAYDYYGRKVGSNENDEGKIFIESNAWCAMARIGQEENMPRIALDNVKKYLDTPYGIVLNYPAYTTYRLELGEITSYPPGYKENGGIFCHNNPWVMIAETMQGNAERAYEYYKKTAPAFLQDIQKLHKLEPYVYAQMIAGKEAVVPGEAKNSWLTGTAAWNFVAITQYILGIRPDYEGLLIDPVIPHKWNGYKVKRIFRTNTYHIEVLNPEHVSKGVKEIRVNGKKIDSNILKTNEKNKVFDVKVILGQ